MSVVRVQKRRDRFTVLSTATLRRTSLSLKARGLWALCMSYPDDWHFRTSHLQAQSDGDGRGAVRSALRELEEAGLAALETPRGEDGRLLGKRWTIYEEAALNPAREGVDVEAETDRETEHPVVGPSTAHRETGLPSVGKTESRSNRRTAHPPLRNNKQHGAPRRRKNEQQQARERCSRTGDGASPEARTDVAAALQRQSGGSLDQDAEAARELVRRGVARGVAHDLARDHGSEAVERAVALYDERRRGPRPPASPGWLVAAVRRRWGARARDEAPLLTHAEMLRWCDANGGSHRTAEFAAVRQPDGAVLFRRGAPPSPSDSPAGVRPNDSTDAHTSRT